MGWEYIAAGLTFSAIGTVGLGVGVLFNGLLTAMSGKKASARKPNALETKIHRAVLAAGRVRPLPDLS